MDKPTKEQMATVAAKTGLDKAITEILSRRQQTFAPCNIPRPGEKAGMFIKGGKKQK